MNVPTSVNFRFAAVYRKFTDVGTFMNELKKLVDEKM